MVVVAKIVPFKVSQMNKFVFNVLYFNDFVAVEPAERVEMFSNQLRNGAEHRFCLL